MSSLMLLPLHPPELWHWNRVYIFKDTFSGKWGSDGMCEVIAAKSVLLLCAEYTYKRSNLRMKYHLSPAPLPELQWLRDKTNV